MPIAPLSTRAFHIGDLLSVVTGVILSPRGELGVAALYAYLCGRPVPLRDAPRVNTALREHIVAVHPGLDGYHGVEVPLYEFAGAWVRRRAREFGPYLVVPPLPREHPLHLELEAVPVIDPSRLPFAACLIDPDPSVWDLSRTQPRIPHVDA